MILKKIQVQAKIVQLTSKSAGQTGHCGQAGQKAGFEVVTKAGVSSACTISCDGTLTLMGRLMEVINWNRLGLVRCVHCLGLTNWCNIGGWEVGVGDALDTFTHNANVLKDILLDSDKDYNTTVTN